jgi:hypothetical protein
MSNYKEQRMVYKINEPASTETLAESQPIIKENFNAANTTFGVDHTLLIDGTANLGKHDKVSWLPHVAATAIPLAPSSMTMMARYTGSHYNLFYKENNGLADGPDTMFTNSAVTTSTAANGCSFLPGGIMIQWGYKAALAGGGSTNINFAALGLADFTAAPFTILTQVRHNGYDADAVACVTAGAATGFTMKNSSSSDRDFYWLVIGPKI